MRQVKTHKFNNVKYKIDLDEIIGSCERPRRYRKREQPTICLPLGLPVMNKKGAKTGLIAIIHEALHAENWDMSEVVVERTALEIGNLLWRLNFRRLK